MTAHPTGTTGTGTALKTQAQAPGRALQRHRSQGEVDELDFASVESKDTPERSTRGNQSIKGVQSVSVQQRLIDWQRRAELDAAPAAPVMHHRQMLARKQVGR